MTALKKATLTQICNLVTDGTHGTPKHVESGFPLIKAKEIVGGIIDFDSCVQISEEEHMEVISRSKPEFGDTLFAHIGASLGESAYINTRRPFSIKNVALFKPNPRVIDGRYLYYLVISPVFQGMAKNRKTGSAQPFLSLGHLRSHQVTFHSDLPTQRKIAAILSGYDDLIENNTRRIAILEEMAQAIYREWFVNFRFPGHENVKLVDSPLGQIPEGWKVGTLDDLTTFSNGFAFKSKELRKEDFGDSYHVFKMGQIVKGGGFDSTKTKSYIEKEKCSTLQKYILRKGDLLMCMTDMKASVALLGHTALMNEDEKYIQNQRVGLVRASNEFGIDFPYLYLLTNSEQFIDDIRSRANSGVQVNLSTAEIRKTKVIIPPKSINENFDKIGKRIRQLVTVLQFKNRNLRATRDLLLPKLISGQLNVEDLDIDMGTTAEALEETTA